MANEKRLIDANDMLKQFSDYMQKLKCYDEYRDGLYRGMEIAESMIKEAPTVDAVEVVYCKDCKHCFHDSKLLAGLVDGVYVCGVWGKGLPRMKPNDFCSYGERRERMKKIVNYLKVFVLLFTMTMGIWIIYAFVWYAVGLPLTDWALWLLLAVAGLTEYGYYRWIREG